jgi:hypothetical protein
MKSKKETVLYDSDAESIDETKYWAGMHAAIMANDPAICPSGDPKWTEDIREKVSDLIKIGQHDFAEHTCGEWIREEQTWAARNAWDNFYESVASYDQRTQGSLFAIFPILGLWRGDVLAYPVLQNTLQDAITRTCRSDGIYNIRILERNGHLIVLKSHHDGLNRILIVRLDGLTSSTHGIDENYLWDRVAPKTKEDVPHGIDDLLKKDFFIREPCIPILFQKVLSM